MIDSGDISRHFIVDKKEEITNIRFAEDSNISEEEVLYNALGHSVFSILKEKNLIFEGWNDKKLFTIVLENSSSELKKKYKNVGLCHARGIKTIKAITPMIELAKRECLIVSDSDSPSKELQQLYRSDKGFGEWKTYQEIDSEIKAITGEDFVKNDYIFEKIKLALPSTMPNFDLSVLPEKRGKLAAIAKFLGANGMSSQQTRDTISKIKNSIFDGLKYKNIDEDYTKLLEGISF
jgi:hypothetical protein